MGGERRPDEGAQAQRPLLVGKLAAPVPRLSSVLRPRLLERLDRGEGTRLRVVVAPAGWGKTTLLGEWADATGRHGPVAWLTLDETDDEPARFWTYVVTALRAAAPDIGEEALAALRVPGLDPIDVAMPTLLNELAGSNSQLVLILDDFHTVADSRIHEAVEFFLAYRPPSLHLVLASRFDPPLPLARMRARGELVEIRAGDLRFTVQEAAGLVSAVIGEELGNQPLEALVDRTEGWAAGLKLAALALRDAPDQSNRAQEVLEYDRHAMDYLMSEVLERLAPDKRQFLLRTSVFDRLCGPLCDAACERTGSHLILRELEHADLFVVPLDAERTWYRYHRLLRDLLRRELQATAPAETRDLLRRAGDWYSQNGHVEDAVRAFFAAGDQRRAADLLLAAEDWFLEHGAIATYLQLGDALDDEVVRSDPRLGVSLANAAGFTGQLDRVPGLLDVAEASAAGSAHDYAGWRSITAAAAVLRATFGYAREGPAATLSHARRAVELETDPALQGWVIARIALGFALQGHGEFAEAATTLDQAWGRCTSAGLPVFTQLLTAGLLALCLLDSGRSDDARRLLRDVAPMVAATERELGDAAAPAVALVHTVAGRLAHRDGQVEEARARLGRAAELARIAGHPSQHVTALTALADAQLGAGDRAAARAALEEARELVDGGAVMPASLARLTAAEVRVGRRTAHAALREHRMVEALSDRELALLRALQGPLTRREIAGELYLSVNTVRGYAKSLYRKLGVESRTQAVRRGRELGLI